MTSSGAELDPELGQLVQHLLYLTGQQDRLATPLGLDPQQVQGLGELWQLLRTASHRQTRCDLLNRILLILRLNPVSTRFFETVFGDLDVANLPELRKRIDRFRMICMLEFGNFRFGYKRFRRGNTISTKWAERFPGDEAIRKREVEFTERRAEPVGFQPIAPEELFSLGYLAAEQAPKLSEARRKLRCLLEDALKQGAGSFHVFVSVAKQCGVQNPPGLVAQTGVSEAAALLHGDLPLFQQGS